jgi:hypothetical protein
LHEVRPGDSRKRIGEGNITTRKNGRPVDDGYTGRNVVGRLRQAACGDQQAFIGRRRVGVLGESGATIERPRKQGGKQGKAGAIAHEKHSVGSAALGHAP